MCDVGFFKTMLLPLHLNLGCNNYVELRYMWTICELVVTCDMHVESCTIFIVCWRWFKILRDTWRTTEFIWAQVCACQRVSRDRHTWSCINWSVLWHLAYDASQGSGVRRHTLSHQGSRAPWRCTLGTALPAVPLIGSRTERDTRRQAPLRPPGAQSSGPVH
jgi:hypothetical protein